MGGPLLDSLEIRRDALEIGKALGHRELDLAYNIPAANAALLKREGFDGELRSYTSRYCYGLVVNFRRKSYLSKRAELRRAIVMALDKDDIVKRCLSGNAIRADAILPRESLDIGERVFIAHDAMEAKRLVDRYRQVEDLSKPINVAFRGYASVSNIQQIAESIERTFTQLGLKANMSFHAPGTAINAFRDEYDLVFLGFLPELDLYSALEPFINPEGGDNYFEYNNAELFKMLNESITIKDSVARKEVFLSILEKLTLDVFMMPLFFNKALVAIPNNIHSVFLTPEESFFPDVVYLSPERGSDEGRRGERPRFEQYGAVIKRLEAETGIIVTTSNRLISTGRNIGKLIDLQKSSIREANELFSSFAESAEKGPGPSRISVGREDP